MQLSHDITINMTRVISIRLFCFCQRRQGCLDIINEFLSIDSFKISTIFIPFFQFCQMAVVLFKGIGMQCLPFVHCSRFFSIRNPSLEISEIRDDAVHFRDIELTRNEIFDSFCFFENSLNVSETSRQLYIHRNTLVYRLDKLQKSTGLDLRVFEDAITFKIALMVVKYMKYMETYEY